MDRNLYNLLNALGFSICDHESSFDSNKYFYLKHDNSDKIYIIISSEYTRYCLELSNVRYVEFGERMFETSKLSKFYSILNAFYKSEIREHKLNTLINA